MSVREEAGIVQGKDLKKAKGGRIKLRYVVQLESGRQVLVNEVLITTPLATELPEGTRLIVRHKAGTVHRASVDKIPTRLLRVDRLDRSKGLIVTADKEGGSLRLTLPVDAELWGSIRSGMQIRAIPRLNQDGTIRYTLKTLKEQAGGKPVSRHRVGRLRTEPQPSPKLGDEPTEPPIPQSPVPVRTRVGTGIVADVQDYYLTVELDQGGKVNCMLSLWPGDVPLQVGRQLRVRYAPDSYSAVKVLEVMESDESADERAADDGMSGAAAEIGVDPAYFARRQREGHRHEIMAFLKDHVAQDHIEWYRLRPAVPARYADPECPLANEVHQALLNTTPDFRFYLHQAQALDAIRARRNVLLVTQTASGKTYCYNPGIFEALRSNSGDAHALYVYPLNALMMDQKRMIDGLNRELAARGFAFGADRLQGGMGRERRLQMASHSPKIVCTNPEMLSVMLRDFRGGHWQSFFCGLRYVVLDEVHLYRGLLGIHMAGIVRRLLLTAARRGATPQFVLSSATVRKPLDLATRLTSLPVSTFTVIAEDSDGSVQEAKHWAVFSPDAGTNGDAYDGYLGAAASAMVDLLCASDSRGRPSPLNTILFAKSMRDVNKAHRMVVTNLARRRPDLAARVRRYISARLSPREKRDIYEGLRDGRYVGVVSTNALEAGIDIGRLDACIIAGFPFTVMRMRQMAGRVGRRQEGLVLFVPHPANPVDEYYRYSPNLLLTQKPEVFVVDAENPYIMRKHLNAAAYELQGISAQEAEIFGSRVDEMIDEAVANWVMRKANGRLFGKRRNYRDLKDVYAIHNLRSNVQYNYAVCPDDVEPCQVKTSCLSPPTGKTPCSKRISLIDREYVYRDCHPGAIYEAGEAGALYRIVSIDERNRVVRAHQLPDDTLERTFVDETMTIDLVGSPMGSRALPNGVRVEWGKARVRRSFEGYYSYTLVPARRCRRCRKEFDETVDTCPRCGRLTETFFRRSKPEHQDFPSPHGETGFQLSLDTLAAWMVVPAEVETKLYDASPCKLPGDKNRVLAFVRKPFEVDGLPRRIRLTEAERQILRSFHDRAHRALAGCGRGRRTLILYPAVYGECLLRALREELAEARALEIFAAVTGYPVTDDLRHVCRRCQTSVLLPAMHTVDHTVVMRYPSVALGHQNDLGSHTTLGHATTGGPTIFWFDNYEGGIGAAEKVFDHIDELLEASWTTIQRCNCTTVEGCPYCTQIGSCDRRNQDLSKPAAAALIHLLLGRAMPDGLGPFVYRRRHRSEFDGTYDGNEYVAEPHGIGTESPDLAGQAQLDPYELLRIQRVVHEPVLHKAFEVRSSEITAEVPPVSAVALGAAFDRALKDPRPRAWQLKPEMDPYQVLEVRPTATLRMIGRVYRVIAREVHPDTNPERRAWANRMMQIVNEAYEKIRKQ